MKNVGLGPPPPFSAVESEAMMRQQAAAIHAQRQAALLGGYGVSQSQATETAAPKQRYRTTTIKIQETSNGQIITVGQIVRLCGRDDHLIDVIAAALAEHEIDSST